MDPTKEAFTMDRAIDPQIIRSMTDPDSALPSLSSLSLQSLMPESVAPPHNQKNLVKKATSSAINFRNRYTPQSKTQPQQTAGSQPFVFSKAANAEMPIGPGGATMIPDEPSVGPGG
jgi:hypothetical protein